MLISVLMCAVCTCGTSLKEISMETLPPVIKEVKSTHSILNHPSKYRFYRPFEKAVSEDGELLIDQLEANYGIRLDVRK